MAFPGSDYQAEASSRKRAREWFVLVERTALRLVMVMTGLTLMVFGLALGVSLVMLPPGVAVGLTGFAVLVWGAFGDLPIDN